MPMLHLFFFVFGEFQAPPIGLEYELQHFQLFSVDPYGRKCSWNDAKEDGVKKEPSVWTSPNGEKKNKLCLDFLVLQVK